MFDILLCVWSVLVSKMDPKDGKVMFNIGKGRLIVRSTDLSAYLSIYPFRGYI
jgi:hypothetical protein